MTRCKSLLRGLLLVCTVIVGALTLTLHPATVHAKTKVTLSCPATITPGAMLNLGLTLENTSATNSVTIAKSTVSAHLGNLNIIGPFAVPLSLTLLPGQTWSNPAYLAATFPSAPHGIFSSLGVAVLDGANKPISGGYCIIEIP